MPGYGFAVGAAIAFTGTVALSETAHFWFSSQMQVDAHELKELFARVARKRNTNTRSARTATRERSRRHERVHADVEGLKAKLVRGRPLSQAAFDNAIGEIKRPR